MYRGHVIVECLWSGQCDGSQYQHKLQQKVPCLLGSLMHRGRLERYSQKNSAHYCSDDHEKETLLGSSKSDDGLTAGSIDIHML